MFLREYRICDSQNIDTEVQFIFRTLKTLGYDIHSIEKAHFRTRTTFYTINQTNDNQFHNVLVLPPVCDKFTARKLLTSETRIVSTTKSQLRNSISKGSVRYSIPCSSCTLKYIGESDDHDRRLHQH